MGQKWRKGLFVQNHPYRSYDVEVDGKLRGSGAGEDTICPKADVKVRALETKKSCSNYFPSSTRPQAENTRPVKFAKKI